MNEDFSSDSGKERSRRGLLALVAAGGAAALAAVLSREDGAEADHGTLNASSATGAPAIHGDNTDGGAGVEGTSAGGPGVLGHSQTGDGVHGISDGDVGVRGESTSNIGVHGHSQTHFGVQGESDGSAGVRGGGQNGPGVRGDSQTGPGGSFESQSANGVEGHSENGAGVRGHSDSGDGVFGETLGGPFAFGVQGASSLPGESGFGVGSSIGVIGQTGSGVGVAGFSNAVSPTPGSPLGSGTGVLGGSGTGTGVLGRSGSGTGVEGFTETGFVAILGVNNSDGGDAVRGLSQNPAAPPGDTPANGSGIGVHGLSGSGLGVMGESGGGPGVFGLGGAAGVQGESNSGPGVLGRAGNSEDSAGVRGEAVGCVQKGPCGPGFGVGVHGRSEAGTGVRAEVLDPAGLALDVVGRARFSTAGAGTIPRNQNSAFVANPAVTTNSHIMVTLAGNPGNRQLHWVERNPGAGFKVILAQLAPGPRPATPFTYLIVEPA